MPLGLLLGMSGFGGAVSVPDAPTSFTATTSYGTVVCGWVEPAGSVTSYKIQQRTTAGPGAWSTIETVAAPATSKTHTLTGVTADTQYDYQVIATNGAGDSAGSNSVTRYTPKVWDTFDGTAGVDLDARASNLGGTPVRLAVTAGSGAHELTGSGAAVENVVGGAHIYWQAGLASGTAAAKLYKNNTTTAGQWGLVFHGDNALNEWGELWIDLAAGNQFILYKRDGGVRSLVASAAITPSLTYQTEYSIKVVFAVNGSAIDCSCSIDGGVWITNSFSGLDTSKTYVGTINLTATSEMHWRELVCTREAG